MDGDYLRSLGMVQGKAAPGSALAQQIESEKADLIAKATATAAIGAPAAAPLEASTKV